MTTVKVQIYLPDGSNVITDAQSNNITIATLLGAIGFQPDYAYVVFTGPYGYEYGTPLIKMDLTMADYNMWHTEKNYVAEFTVYNKADTGKYNVLLYNAYYENDG